MNCGLFCMYSADPIAALDAALALEITGQAFALALELA